MKRTNSFGPGILTKTQWAVVIVGGLAGASVKLAFTPLFAFLSWRDRKWCKRKWCECRRRERSYD